MILKMPLTLYNGIKDSVEILEINWWPENFDGNVIIFDEGIRSKIMAFRYTLNKDRKPFIYIEVFSGVQKYNQKLYSKVYKVDIFQGYPLSPLAFICGIVPPLTYLSAEKCINLKKTKLPKNILKRFFENE